MITKTHRPTKTLIAAEALSITGTTCFYVTGNLNSNARARLKNVSGTLNGSLIFYSRANNLIVPSLAGNSIAIGAVGTTVEVIFPQLASGYYSIELNITAGTGVVDMTVIEY